MKDNDLKICEVFDSISGEGLRTGMPATFIRFSGCNLCCDYCDTKYHKEVKYTVDMTTDDISAEFAELIRGKKFVVLTGGEPGIQDFGQLSYLIKELCNNGTETIEIETNSANLDKLIRYFSPSKFNANIHFSADLKLNYMDELSYGLEALTGFAKLGLDDCIKVVVSSYADIECAAVLADKFKNTNVIVSPCYGEISPTEIAEYLVNYKKQNVRMQIQLHKYLWEADKRGV